MPSKKKVNLNKTITNLNNVVPLDNKKSTERARKTVTGHLPEEVKKND